MNGKKIQALKSQAPKGYTAVPGLILPEEARTGGSKQGIGTGGDQGNLHRETLGEICGQGVATGQGLFCSWMERAAAYLGMKPEVCAMERDGGWGNKGSN